MSWRDTASARAQQDLDNLLNASIGFAQQELAKRGEFFPYAAAIRTDGEPEVIAAGLVDDDVDHPQTAEVLGACFAALVGMRERIRAGAVISDVRTGDGGEAINVDLEHAEGQSLVVWLPYVRRNGGQVHYGEVQAAGGRRQIWV